MEQSNTNSTTETETILSVTFNDEIIASLVNLGFLKIRDATNPELVACEITLAMLEEEEVAALPACFFYSIHGHSLAQFYKDSAPFDSTEYFKKGYEVTPITLGIITTDKASHVLTHRALEAIKDETHSFGKFVKKYVAASCQAMRANIRLTRLRREFGEGTSQTMTFPEFIAICSGSDEKGSVKMESYTDPNASSSSN